MEELYLTLLTRIYKKFGQLQEMLNFSTIFDLKQHKESETICQILITSKKSSPYLKTGIFT